MTGRRRSARRVSGRLFRLEKGLKLPPKFPFIRLEEAPGGSCAGPGLGPAVDDPCGVEGLETAFARGDCSLGGDHIAKQ